MNQLGYYGKTPQRGDFVRFNLPASFVKVWDDWLQQIMIKGETTYAATWSDIYHAAPAYRFAWSSGIGGETAWMGVVLPSKDKVGRRFPFCLALSFQADTDVLLAMHQQEAWFQESEQLVRRLINGEEDFDNLQSVLQAMLETHQEQPPTSALTAATPESEISVSLLINSSRALTQHATCLSLLNASLIQTLGSFSVWRAADASDHCLLSSGLPDENRSLALFSQQWTDTQTSQLDVSQQLISSTAEVDAVRSISDVAVLAAAGAATDTIPDLDGTLVEDMLKKATTDADDSIDTAADVTEVATDNTTADPVEAVEGQQVPSADDWAALDEFSSNELDEVELPEAEKLELDEDESSTAPWET